MHVNEMISIGKYLRGREPLGSNSARPDGEQPSAILLHAYRDAIETIGRCSLEISPAQGSGLLQSMEAISGDLLRDSASDAVKRVRGRVHKQLITWSRGMAQYLQHQTREVKEVLLVLARIAERAGERDHRCARHIEEITSRLQAIASYDDLALMRTSILAAAAEMKKSIGAILEESSSELAELRAQVAASRDLLEQAERLATHDTLTQLPNRLSIEREILRRMAQGKPFSIALLDLNDFKTINDNHGHLVGDEILRQFAAELRTACQCADTAGRWGGDELILVLDCPLSDAQSQTERISRWVCGIYLVGSLRLRVDACIGVAEHQPGEGMQQLLERADSAMYRRKRLQ
jgi:diguanylate cyclase (GGDEF)-like protein